MRERPILFSGPMVRAILEGRKTQTRRLVKGRDLDVLKFYWGTYDELEGSTELMGQALHEKTGLLHVWCNEYPADGQDTIRCPYGAPGDSLWVRETWQHEYVYESLKDVPPRRRTHKDCRYKATEETKQWWIRLTWRPSIHMPRWASRITLEVTGVRVERLHDISKSDAVDEGARRFDSIPTDNPYPGSEPRWSMEEPTHTRQCLGSPQMAFANLWNKLNGPDSWDANPFVWVVEFKRVDAKAVAA